MGIKFNCPNGHKLNVKSFLAGKKGVCPHCGAKFRIPLEGGDDEAPAARGANGAKARVVGVASPAGAAVVPAMPPFPAATGAAMPTPVMPLPAAAPAMPMPGAAAPYGAPAVPIMPAPGPALPMPGAAAPYGAPAMPPMPAPALADAISEAPAASWYVRPPSGSQYGPARGDVMRKWIAEGRVSGDSLVWREGWADWRTAGQVFPSLGAAGVAASLPVPAPSPSPRTARIAAVGKKKKGGSGLAIAALVLLGIVCLALVGVLVAVVTMK